MLIGFFIEPDYRLKKIVINYKKQIKENLGDQIYLNHPVHSTLFTINIKKSFSVNKIFETIKFIKNFKKIKIKVSKVNFFYNDPITKENTCFLGVKRNTLLINFQRDIIKLINKNYGSEIIRKNNFKGLMKKNFDLFGYPFVYKNWKPHFTISSIKKKKDINFVRNLLKKKEINISFNLKKISIWRINKDTHRRIKIINL